MKNMSVIKYIYKKDGKLKELKQLISHYINIYFQLSHTWSGFSFSSLECWTVNQVQHMILPALSLAEH